MLKLILTQLNLLKMILIQLNLPKMIKLSPDQGNKFTSLTVIPRNFLMKKPTWKMKKTPWKTTAIMR